MKVCTLCGKSRSEADYYFKNKQTNKLHSQCKECYSIKRKAMWDIHYQKYGNSYRERAVERNRMIKRKTRMLMLNYLGDKCCIRCGNNDVRVLEFDHIEPSSKSFSIARGITSTYSWEKILSEIEKCQILCANCHKIKTAEEAGWYKNLAGTSD